MFENLCTVNHEKKCKVLFHPSPNNNRNSNNTCHFYKIKWTTVFKQHVMYVMVFIFMCVYIKVFVFIFACLGWIPFKL